MTKSEAERTETAPHLCWCRSELMKMILVDLGLDPRRASGLARIRCVLVIVCLSHRAATCLSKIHVPLRDTQVDRRANQDPSIITKSRTGSLGT